MKNSTLALTTLCALLSVPALADTADILSANNQLGAQYISTNVDYTETGNGLYGTPTGTLDTEKGNVSGYALSLSIMRNWWLGNDYLKLGYSHNNGDTSYVGQSISSTTNTYGSITGTDGAKIEDYYVRYGKGFSTSENTMLTPYFELGHHSWDRNINYGETYTNRWYGIGLLGDYTPVHKLTLSADLMVGNNYGSYINVVDAFAGSLGNSSVYKVGVAADYAFTRNFHANLGVDYTSFKYGASAVYPVGYGYVGWEPDSTTHYTTARVGVGYSF